jgi:LysR family transcriptional regulator of beta-lactamase
MAISPVSHRLPRYYGCRSSFKGYSIVAAIRNSHGGFTSTSVSLNALRAFEAAARHLSFTRAGLELSVTQAAISHQVKGLEERLGIRLFRRTPRGLVVTDEGQALLPTLTDTFERLSRLIEQLEGGRPREVLTVGVVGSFAVGWLIPRLDAFNAAHPMVDMRILINNNRVDLAGESLDYAIRFGEGAWHGVEAVKLMDAPMTPLCGPRDAERLREPGDLAGALLLRSYRHQDWPAWLHAAGIRVTARGPMFDSSPLMIQSAMLNGGVALAPASLFRRELADERLVQPFELEIDVGAYWLTKLITRPETQAMAAFREWIVRA